MQRIAAKANAPRMAAMSRSQKRTWVVSGSGEELVDRKFLTEERGSKPSASLPARNNTELTNTTKHKVKHKSFAISHSTKVRREGGQDQVKAGDTHRYGTQMECGLARMLQLVRCTLEPQRQRHTIAVATYTASPHGSRSLARTSWNQVISQSRQKPHHKRGS